MEKERNSGIDLLRIVLMLMICVLHVLGHGGVIKTSGSNHHAIWILEELCICAVDGYALISGYFAQDKPQNYKRIIKLWFTALFYSAGITVGIAIINLLTGKCFPISIKEVIKSFMPVSYGNWYFTAYFAIFFISPFVNKVIDKINEKESKKLLILLFFIFSVLTLITDNWFSKGYSAFWLLILYILGALIKKSKMFNNLSKTKLFLLYVFASFITWILNVVLNISVWNYYTSPTVLLSAIMLLVLFSKIKIDNRIVKTVAPLTFGIYLFHDNPYVRLFFISECFVFVNNYHFVLSIIMSILIAICIFAASAIVDYIRTKIFKLLNIDTLCSKIEALISTVINKVCR